MRSKSIYVNKNKCEGCLDASEEHIWLPGQNNHHFHSSFIHLQLPSHSHWRRPTHQHPLLLWQCCQHQSKLHCTTWRFSSRYQLRTTQHNTALIVIDLFEKRLIPHDMTNDTLTTHPLTGMVSVQNELITEPWCLVLGDTKRREAEAKRDIVLGWAKVSKRRIPTKREEIVTTLP